MCCPLLRGVEMFKHFLNVEVDPVEVIAGLASEVFALKGIIANQVQKNEELLLQVKKLEEVLSSSLSREFIAGVVKRHFDSGGIPVPSGFVGLPEVRCAVYVLDNFSLIAKVTFSSDGRDLVLPFAFVPVPSDYSYAKKYYPEFHMGFTKQNHEDTSEPEPGVPPQESGVIKAESRQPNPYPCTGNPS
jgi:hypothetical protein